MDDADRSQADQELLLERQLAATLDAARRILHPRTPGTDTCVECGAEIPVMRRRILPHTRHCTACADSVENLRARGIL
jgi:phage/conjugal plasmid C-4 type zinc finger TraR family protein